MAQDPDRPKDDGKIKLPAVDNGMNKLGPVKRAGGKGSKKDGAEEKKKGKDKDNSELLAKIRKRMERCISQEAENRRAALDDLKFKSGEGQWPADVAAQRNFDKRPCLTINKLPTFVNQITNDQRQNRPSINISPVGDKGDIEVAKMYRGLIRYLERASHADVAYDTAFDGAVSNGFGYWRTLTEFDGPDTFNQTIVVQRIRNPFTVYLDPDHQEPDGSDSRYGFITEMIPREDFKRDWPEADQMPFDQSGVGESMKNWMDKDNIRIAEYFEIKTDKRTLVALSNGFVGWKDELSDEARGLIDKGDVTVERERESDCPKVVWYKVTAKDVLSEKPWLGKWIPIVKVIGNEIDIEGKVKYSGVIRNAKQPQLMYNYMRTLAVELTSLQPKAPYIVEEGQIEGHEQQWKQANNTPFPYLLYRAVNVNGNPAPPPQRQPFQGAPGAVLQEVQIAAQDMMATTGIRFDATMGERMVDESGRAIRELRRSGDLGSFHYVDNLARSLKHQGDIFVDLIPKIIDTKRMLTILREDDTEEQVMIDPTSPKPFAEGKHPQTGKKLKIFNPTYGKYGVTVTIGPSYATKRIEASESMMDFVKAVPSIAPAIVDLVAKNQDWPGAAEFATRLAKVVAMSHPGIMSPDIKDVPPQVQAMLTSMDAQIKQMMAERQQMMKALNDQNADRAIDMDKINKDFEAKLLKVVADVETKSAATHEKAVASWNSHIGSRIDDLGANVATLMDALTSPSPGNQGESTGG